MTEVAALSPKRFVQPEVVATHFHLREGDAVADFGAGSGFFTKALSTLVGPQGIVYACEIQKNLVETIGGLVRQENLSNVDVIWCDLEEMGCSKIPDNTLDVGILINTLFQLQDKDIALEEIKRTLRPGGRLIVVDWTESFAGLGPQPNDVITEADARALIERHAYTFEQSFDAADHHYGLTFRL